MTAHAVVLVEGESDRIALETLAARRGRDLAGEGVAVVAIGGAQAVGRAVAGYAGLRVGGLYDIGEESAVLRRLERAGVPADGFFACDPDLEGELVRSLGPERMLELVESRGQLGAFETYRKQPAQRASRSRRSCTVGCTTGRSATRRRLSRRSSSTVFRAARGVLAWVGPPRLS